mgnify:CR=1 FL=1
MALETSVRAGRKRPARRHPATAPIHRRKPFHRPQTCGGKARLHPLPSFGPAIEIDADAMWKELRKRGEESLIGVYCYETSAHAFLIRQQCCISSLAGGRIAASGSSDLIYASVWKT